MTDRLNLPALGNFLRSQAPSAIIHDSNADDGSGASQLLDATRWLERLADVLGCSSNWLLETGRVTPDDLAERGPIAKAARLIHSNGWQQPPPLEPGPRLEPPLSRYVPSNSAAWCAA